ncbi:MAG: phosphoglycolate phosphatase [Cereibacter sphaeroides]|uniref:Phosphoglycolate phosphatase n=1 Tax=Cereibacter sphaeroides TaxID=1063 RepID=A0A2W5SIW8_CERSP|nr:MAG: phosphoglycolate phosphatase [Cereibacter sphaeroides]
MARVIFDLDGTLVDSAPDIHASVNFLLAELGRPSMPLAMVKSFIGNGAPVLLDRVLDACGFPEDAALRAGTLARFLEIYEANSSVLTRLYPHVVSSLSRLVEDGHSLGLCTNKPEVPARQVLEVYRLADLMGAVIGGDSLPQRKPDPAPLLAVAALLPPGLILYVGDSEVDAETAERASVPFILFTEGYRKAPVEALPAVATFSDFAELPAITAHLARD